MRHRAKINVRRIGHGRSLEEGRDTHALGGRGIKARRNARVSTLGEQDAWGAIGVCRDIREDWNSDSRI